MAQIHIRLPDVGHLFIWGPTSHWPGVAILGSATLAIQQVMSGHKAPSWTESSMLGWQRPLPRQQLPHLHKHWNPGSVPKVGLASTMEPCGCLLLHHVVVPRLASRGFLQFGFSQFSKEKSNPNHMRTNTHTVLFDFIVANELRLQGRGANVRQ